MAVDHQKSQQAPMFELDLDEDVMYAFRLYSRVYGGKPLSQGGQKGLQALLVVYAGLSVKERGPMGKDTRNMAASKCMQELAVPGFIKLIEKAQADSGNTLPMPLGWKDLLYYTTLGKGGLYREGAFDGTHRKISENKVSRHVCSVRTSKSITAAFSNLNNFGWVFGGVRTTHHADLRTKKNGSTGRYVQAREETKTGSGRLVVHFTAAMIPSLKKLLLRFNCGSSSNDLQPAQQRPAACAP